MKVSAKICGYSMLLSLCATLFCAPALGGQDDVVRIDSNLVNVFFSVLGKDGFSTSLDRTDIKIFEDGQQQEISLFQRETDRPLAIAILIDTSGSEKRGLSFEQAASKSFIDEVLRRESDRVAIISFAADPFLEQPLTNNPETAKRVVDRVKSMLGRKAYAGNGTILPVGTKPADGSLSFTSAIWDAAWITCRHVLSELPMGTRKIIVVLTDGEDTSSRANLDEAIEIAVKSDAVIYAIGIGDTSLSSDVNKHTLGDLAFRTGGQMFLPKKEEELSRAFERISEELHSQYLLTYVPTNRNRSQAYRQVRIEMSNPQLRKQRLRLIYRSGYYFRGS